MSETKRTLNDKNEAKEAECRGGELLKQMKERGERKKSGGDYTSEASFHDESMLPICSTCSPGKRKSQNSWNTR